LRQLSRLLRSNVKFRHLQLIVSISERLHIGRVAEHLSLSQPAVSKSLAEIESIVGSQLFERTPSGLIETREGKVFAEYAREALAQLGRLGDDLEAAQLGHAGTIVVGSVVAVSASPDHSFSKLRQNTIRMVKGHGIEGDAHAGRYVRHRYLAKKQPFLPNLRQVHLMPIELFEEVRKVLRAQKNCGVSVVKIILFKVRQL